MARKAKTTKVRTKVPKRVPERAPGARRPSGGLTAEERMRSATIVETTPGPRGGRTRARFPMPDKAHARNALARLNQAQGLTAEEKAAIRRRAERIIYGGEKTAKTKRRTSGRRSRPK
ncbi:MAG: hypothetical protein QJR08_03745 [Bacillota bacterium]|nr:hypothetical protein [Bacillota bacterium]